MKAIGNSSSITVSLALVIAGGASAFATLKSESASDRRRIEKLEQDDTEVKKMLVEMQKDVAVIKHILLKPRR